MGTGHMMTFEKAQSQILSTLYSPSDPKLYQLYISSTKSPTHHKKNQYHIFFFNKKSPQKIFQVTLPLDIKKWPLQIHLQTNKKNVSLEDYFKREQIKESFVFLKKYEILSFFSHLKKRNWFLEGKQIFPYTITHFIQQNYRFIKKDDGLFDQLSKTLYRPNWQTGFFESSNGDKILPGFRVSVGFKNYKELFQDKRLRSPFFKVFSWTIAWAIFSVIFTFVVGIFFAILLNRKNLSGRPIYRIFLIIPYAIPFFISVLIFKGLLNQDFGIINEILQQYLNIRPPWLTDSILAKISCLLVNTWLGFPYMFLITTGVLQSIPPQVFEASEVDGASSLTQFLKITLPLILENITPLLLGSFAFNFNNFVGIYLLTGGLPPMEKAHTPVGETDILISYTYRLAFEGSSGQNFGLASTISVLIFLIIGILTYIKFKTFNRQFNK